MSEPRDAAVRVRVATAADRPAVASLMAKFRDWMGRTRPSDAELRAGVAQLIADPGVEYLLAVSEGEVAVGVCQLRFRYGIWYSADDCLLEDLFVTEQARGGGAGRALVEAALERARERGCRRIELDADADNEAALALYEGFGFSAHTQSGAKRLMLRLLL